MPKKAKDELIKEENPDTKKKSSASKASRVSQKIKTVKKNENAIENKISKISKKSSEAVKKSKTSKKSTVPGGKSAKVSSKKSVSSKAAKSTKSKTSAKKAKSSTKKVFLSEYYDLPNAYNQTVVKILAQTPTILFAYWDISIEDVQNFINTYGEGFFNDTVPYLIVTNQSKNYSFEVEINDYANSWYIHIPDSDCKYDISLIRKPKNNNINIENNYVFIASSNDLQTPNDHILFENFSKSIFFKNVKTGSIEEKDISSLYFMRKIGRIYNIYDLYKEIYKNELNGNKLDEKLTSSKMSS